ncbi:MAG: type II toxin-antitoxin system Phd/YefM family antitoxin [Clostridia bacterium]|jgi:antitoxin Phd|nr:type II toxin-antitoxin system Phd/YefM family antitoxin [Clostridia bacterium]
MTINTNQMLSISEVNQNFSKATRIADKQGSVVIFKNNKPVYVMLNLQAHPMIELSDDEKVEVVAKRILEKHRKAFEVLAE